MIGWWIVVVQRTPEEWDATLNKEAVLANWETSLSGIDWIEALVKAGKVAQLSRGGYPNRYTAVACEILPHIVGGPPRHDGPTIMGDDYVMPGSWMGNVQIHHDKIAACPSDQILTIDVWDQS